MSSLSDTPRLQYYDVQTLEYRYISKLPMKKERIWSNVKETTSHFQNKLTKNIDLGVTTRSSTKWYCLKPIRFHQYTWGLQHFLTFLQEDIGHIKCYNCVKFHKNSISCLGGVGLTRYTTSFSWKYKLNYLPFPKF